MRTLKFLPKADADFKRIYEHYAIYRAAPEFAARVSATIKNEINTILPYSPGIGRKISDHTPNQRALLVNRAHWVLYKYNADSVTIYRILSAKELTSWDDLD